LPEARKRSWGPAVTPSAPTPAGGLLNSGRSGQPDGCRVAALTAEGKSAEDACELLRFVLNDSEPASRHGARSAERATASGAC